MKRTILFGLLLAVVISVAPLAALAPAAEAGSAYSGQQCVYHTVRVGQTLSGIASYYGVNMWTIAQRNGIANPNRIYAGQTLLIYCYTPKPPPPPAPPPPPPPPPVSQGPCTPPATVSGLSAATAASSIVQHRASEWASATSGTTMPTCAMRSAVPRLPSKASAAAQQAFQFGYAVANDTTGVVYVLYNNGTWQQFQNTWTPGMPSYNPAIVPPPGFCQPEYGIGEVWRTQPGVSQKLGWGKYSTQMTTGTSQQYQGGMMLWTQSSGVWVLYNNGTFQRF